MKIKESQVFQKHPLKHKLTVEFRNRQTDLPLSKSEVVTFVSKILEMLKVVCDAVAVHFVTEQEIAKLHQIYFDDDSVTDTISFPLDSPGTVPLCHLGEVFVCPSVARKYSKRHGLDPYEETMLYLTHGILHLLGYDDQDPKSRKKMRAMERKCMQLLLRSDER
ncbi:MAG: rRNA maturation RNase YbeY [Chlamydiales bacterium]